MNKHRMLKVFAISSAVIIFGGCAPTPTAEPAISHTVATPTAPDNSITVRGIVESVESRNVYTTLGFMVEQVYVQEGDYVAEGQVLAVLDTADLTLAVAQQRASLELARQNSQNILQDTQRMLSEATANLANNTNLHILSAEASLSAAEINLETAQRNHDDALRDYQHGNNTHILNAESALRSARIELDTRETSYSNLRMLYNSGALPREDMRHAENAKTNAQNNYNDARSNYENATTSQQRNLQQLESALQSATTAYNNARDLQHAARVAAEQDIARLRSSVANAQTSANLEHMEIALQQLERQLEDSIITAPISGAVTSAIAREGAVGLGLLFVVEDTNNLKITTSFREYDIGRVAQGKEVSITSDATGSAAYSGVISRINPAATASAPVVEFEAEILVTSVNTGLRIGMTTRTDVILAE